MKILTLLSYFPEPLRSTDLPIEILQVARARQTNRELLTRLPSYTCLETLFRGLPEGRSGKRNKRDVVQVDVGSSDDQEMYSWPGATTFSARSLGELIGHGLIATGLFHSFPADVFVFGHGAIKSAGEADLGGQAALRFTYTIPSLEERWEMDWMGSRGSMGEAGEFWVDKNSYALLRLHVSAVDIASSLPLKSVDVNIDYQLLSLNGKAGLLPRSGELTIVDNEGKTHHNDAAFSHCRVFASESKMTNSGVSHSHDGLPEVLTRYEAHRAVIPGGITLQMALDTAIDAESAKVGDTISARLGTPVTVSPGVTVPANTPIAGRIREFEKLADRKDSFLVGLEFDELSWGGQSYSFLAQIVSVQSMAGLSPELITAHESTADTFAGTLNSGFTERLTANFIPGTATFFMQKRHDIPKGLKMTWRTEQLNYP